METAAVDVYRTNITTKKAAQLVLDDIKSLKPVRDVSLDLEDCDKVLRIEHTGENSIEYQLRNILKRHGYNMNVLP